MDLRIDFQCVVMSHTETGRRPFSHSIHGQKSCLLKGRWEKSACSMRFVMFWINDFSLITRLFFDQIRYPEFFFDPNGHGFPEGPDSNWGKGEIGFQQPFEFDERFVIKSHVIQVATLNARRVQTIPDGVSRESKIMLFPGKSFLLRP